MNPGLAIWTKLTPYALPVLGVLVWLASRGDIQWIIASKAALGWICFGAGLSVSSEFWLGRW